MLSLVVRLLELLEPSHVFFQYHFLLAEGMLDVLEPSFLFLEVQFRYLLVLKPAAFLLKRGYLRFQLLNYFLRFLDGRDGGFLKCFSLLLEPFFYLEIHSHNLLFNIEDILLQALVLNQQLLHLLLSLVQLLPYPIQLALMNPALATRFLLLSFTTGNRPACSLTLLLLSLQQSAALGEVPAQLQALAALRLQF